LPVFGAAAVGFAGAGIEIATVAGVAEGATGSGTVNPALDNAGVVANSSAGAAAVSSFAAEGVVVAVCIFGADGVIAVSSFGADGVVAAARGAIAEAGAGSDKFWVALRSAEGGSFFAAPEVHSNPIPASPMSSAGPATHA